MIKITNYRDLKKYFDIPEEAIAFMENATPSTENGRYDFGNDCHINVMDSATHVGSGLMEAHDVYVDAQCLLSGEEKILYADKTALPIATPYDTAKEAAFYSFENADEVTYKAGECVVLYPVEAHLPCRAVNEPMPLKKAVIKLNYQKLRRI